MNMEQQLVASVRPCFENLPSEVQKRIFSYCGPKTRREISLVCKDWAEKLKFFHEDFKLYLHKCSLQEDIEPLSLLMKSTRHYYSLSLRQIHFETRLAPLELLIHLGKHVQELEMSMLGARFLQDPDLLLFFPKLKKLSLVDLQMLTYFERFPETLEHVHLELLSIIEWTERFEMLKLIKNLKVLTSDSVCVVPGAQFVSYRGSRTTVFSLDEHLKDILESMQSLRHITLKCDTNFIDAPALTLDDVCGIDFQRAPTTFHQFNKFVHLRSIHILWGKDQIPPLFCFNFHQATLCPKVVELQIIGNKQQACIDCFKSLIDSWPNVEKIVLKNWGMTNQHVKHICFKLPKVKHLEVDGKTINHEIICTDQPDHLLGNLTQLETLLLPNFTADKTLLKWPFMLHLKKVQFGVLSNDLVLINFIEKTPNLEHFQIDDGSLLSDTGIQIIAQNWPKLHTLVLHSTMPCDVSAIKQFCRGLWTLELHLYINPVHTTASFFEAIPTLWNYVGLRQKSGIYRFQLDWDEDRLKTDTFSE